MVPWPRPYVWDLGKTPGRQRICLFSSVAEAQLCGSSTGFLLNRTAQMLKDGNNVERGTVCRTKRGQREAVTGTREGGGSGRRLIW